MNWITFHPEFQVPSNLKDFSWKFHTLLAAWSCITYHSFLYFRFCGPEVSPRKYSGWIADHWQVLSHSNTTMTPHRHLPTVSFQKRSFFFLTNLPSPMVSDCCCWHLVSLIGGFLPPINWKNTCSSKWINFRGEHWTNHWHYHLVENFWT